MDSEVSNNVDIVQRTGWDGDLDVNHRHASEAVKFVVRHLKKGVVPLCVEVAQLLENNERLAREVEDLKRGLVNRGDEDLPRTTGDSVEPNCKFERLPVQGCLCQECCRSVPPYLSLPASVTGGRALVSRHRWSICVGNIFYVGHLDCGAPRKLWAGLRLDEPVGWTDGHLQGKRYFTCESHHGIFVPLSSIIPVLGCQRTQASIGTATS